MANPFYQQKDFRTEKLAALKGLMSDRRANRVVNRYMKSEAGQQEELKFAQDESNKYMASVDAFIEAGRQRREGMHQAALQNINTSLANRQPADAAVEQNPTSNANSNPVLVARKQPQRKPVSQKAPASAPAPVAVTEPTPAQPVQETPVQPVQEAPVTPQFNLSAFAKSAGLNESRVFDGRTFYRYDPDGVGDFWISEDGNIFNASIGGGLGRMRSGTIDASSMPNYERLVQALNAAKSGQAVSRLGRLAKGGSLNRINYFQQGGAAQKQSAKAQVVALVQAAMQGDEKAQQQVAQILEAAKAGDQKMIPLAQMITAVAEQLQGQATAAKWGAKLNYIQSLKFAKGGKTCPACEKKVEMKACGGKKAKKHYEGGFLSSKIYPAEKYGYTAQEQIPTRKGNVLVSDPDNTPRRVILENTRRMPNGTFVNDTLYFRNAADQQKALSPKYGMSNPDQLRYKFGAVDYFGNTKVNPNKAAFESYLK